MVMAFQGLSAALMQPSLRSRTILQSSGPSAGEPVRVVSKDGSISPFTMRSSRSGRLEGSQEKGLTLACDRPILRRSATPNELERAMSDATHAAENDPQRLPDPVIRTVTRHDIVEALAAGLRDFRAAPLYGLFFGAVYVAGGLSILACLSWLDMSYLAYPLAAGFAMIGPFVASGLYEVSRRRETGEPLSFGIVLWSIWEQRRREMGWMAFVAIFLLIVWLYQVRLLIALFLGLRSFSTMAEFMTVLTSTPEGLMFLAVGHVVGALLAALAYTLTVVSFPLLVDRDHDFITAIITSFRAVAANPVVMLGWAACVVALMILASLPMFLGLVIVLPVLGHATWHIYRRVVEPLPG